MNWSSPKSGARLAGVAVHLLALCAALSVTIPYLIGVRYAQQAGMALRGVLPSASSPLLPLLSPLSAGSEHPALQQALRLSQQALRWHRFSAKARQNLAFVYLLAGDYPAASAELGQLARFPVYGNVESAERMVLYASASLLAGDTAQVAADWQSMGLEEWAFIQAGDTYWEAYADAEAELLYKSALLLAPASSDAWAAWGRFQARSRQFAPALEGYEKAVQLGGFQHYVLVKCAKSPHIYRLEGEQKRWIKDIPTFEAEGYVWEDVQIVECDYIRKLPDGPPIPPDAGPPPQP